MIEKEATTSAEAKVAEEALTEKLVAKYSKLTEDETAEVLGISVRTAKRDWPKARSWLYTELYDDPVT